jgi:hypothetical protein
MYTMFLDHIFHKDVYHKKLGLGKEAPIKVPGYEKIFKLLVKIMKLLYQKFIYSANFIAKC